MARPDDEWSRYRITGPGFMSLPAFLSSMKHRNPSDPHHSNWQHLRQDEYNFFQWINKDPEIARMFQTVMGQYSANKPFLTALYPIDELVKRSSAKADRAILVDVGGGAGHDLERVRECFPQLPEGSLVLQDVPEVLSQTTMKPPIIAMAHNMFDPQPIKGTHTKKPSHPYSLTQVTINISPTRSRRLLLPHRAARLARRRSHPHSEKNRVSDGRGI